MRIVRADVIEGRLVSDPQHIEFRTRVFRAVKEKFDGKSLYEAGLNWGFTKKQMKEFWKRNRYRGYPIIERRDLTGW